MEGPFFSQCAGRSTIGTVALPIISLTEVCMKTPSINPLEFGVDESLEDFCDQIADDFNSYFRGQESIHELLGFPRHAHQFCKFVRRNREYSDVPDDVILQCVVDRCEFDPEEIVLAVPCLSVQILSPILVPIG